MLGTIFNSASNFISLVTKKITTRIEYLSKLKVVSLTPNQASKGNVYPSACEGQAGAVITSLQAGLIPIIS